MSSTLDPEKQKKPKSNFSRRGFLKGVSITGGALTTGILESEAEAQSPPAVAGPGEVPITLTVNGRARKVNVERFYNTERYRPNYRSKLGAPLLFGRS